MTAEAVGTDVVVAFDAVPVAVAAAAAANIIIRLAPAFKVAIPELEDDVEEECCLFLPELLLLEAEEEEAENPGRKENFESSPTVVTSMSDSSLLLSEVFDPVEELSSLDLVLLENDALLLVLLLQLLSAGYGGSEGVSHML